MKNRLILGFLLVVLWSFLIGLQIYQPLIPSVIFIFGFIIAYCLILSLTQVLSGFEKSKILQKQHDSDYFPFVNIFIPAHNEELVIGDTVENIVKIDYPNFDILVIDDRSTDRTAEIVKGLEIKYPGRVRLLSRDDQSIPGKSAVLNDALKVTDGELICVFDADARVKENFLIKLLPSLANNQTAAVQARKSISNRDYNFFTRVQHYEYCSDSYLQTCKSSLKGAVELRGNGQILKREALNRVNGWNINTVTDDLDISTRLYIAGYKIAFCSDVCVYEEGITDVISIYHQRIRWAEGSIRRYLDYIFGILGLYKSNLTATLDMLAFFSEFILPVWLISDFIIQFILAVNLKTENLIVNIAVWLLMCAFFTFLNFLSLRKFEGIGIIQALKWSLLTAVYIVLLWTIVVVVVFFKIMLRPRTLKWSKTNHSGSSISCG